MAATVRISGLALLLTALLSPGPASLSASTIGSLTATPAPRDLPAGAPPALYRAEPVLPAPRGWPFGEAFPRTSGFGRVVAGASLWSDFLYDDHGAKGLVVSAPVVGLSPPEGTYAYPAGPAAENGADIFRAAVGLDAGSTWWRVDWLGLPRPALPAAMWALDTDASAATGAAAWPAGAGVSSAGVERWLFVSGKGAWLLDAAGGRVPVPSSVDYRSASFVVRVPRTVLPVSGRWHVRLASGLANAAGDGFAPIGADAGALPGQPALFNVAFRSDAQEPVAGENWWREDRQAAALAAGDISAFARDVDWPALAAHRSEPEPRPTGYTNRWYVSSVAQGHGIARNPPQASSDLRPNYLDRVQPYGIFVPAGVAPTTPVPLTVLLHSLNTQHNQYATWNPAFLESLCQGRRSICLVPLARGPDSWFFDEGELDVWETWNRVASAYALDPARTILAGYSMGGYGTYRMGLEHPDVFAQAVAMAGPPNCAVRVVSPAEVPADPGVAGCEHEADTSPLVGNARQLPFYIAQGAIDELVFSPSALEQARRFDTFGYRYRFELYARQGHVSWAETGHFEGAVAWLQDRRLAPTPARVSYTFYPSHQRPDLGTGPTGAWWISGLAARSHVPGATATVTAVSHALPTGEPALVRSNDAVLNTDGPAAVQQLLWGAVAPSTKAARVDLTLRGVQDVALDLTRAGLRGPSGSVHVDSDGPTRLLLAGLRSGSTVRVQGVAVTTADAHGRAAVITSSGSTVVDLAWSPATAPAAIPAGTPATDAALPATGGSPSSFAAALLLGALLLTGRHHWSSRAST
jgi:predicted esterase